MKNGEGWLLILCWSSICSPPQDPQRWSPFMKSERWMLILSLLICLPKINTGDHLFMQKWVYYWSSLLIIDLPPGSTEVIAFSCKGESWLLILSLSPPKSTEAIAFSHAEVITFSCAEEIALWHAEAITFSHAETVDPLCVNCKQ